MTEKNKRSRHRILAMGYCPACGREPLFSRSLGFNCLLKQRDRMRARQRLQRGIPLDAPIKPGSTRTEDAPWRRYRTK